MWDNCQSKPKVPPQLYDPARGAHFRAVPIPDEAAPASGRTASSTVWDPVTDQLWEFWKAHREADGWHACWGGRIDRVSTSPGYFPDGIGRRGQRARHRRRDDRHRGGAAGRIDHALALPTPRDRALEDLLLSGAAQRRQQPAGAADRIPEGSRLRLDPTLDVDSLRLTPSATMVAKAAQKYGFIVTDKAGAVAVRAESGAEVQRATGVDPWGELMQGARPSQVLRGFPWDRLQVLPMDWGKPCGVIGLTGLPARGVPEPRRVLPAPRTTLSDQVDGQVDGDGG